MITDQAVLILRTDIGKCFALKHKIGFQSQCLEGHSWHLALLSTSRLLGISKGKHHSQMDTAQRLMYSLSQTMQTVCIITPWRVLSWIVEFERANIFVQVSMMSSHLALPHWMSKESPPHLCSP